MCATYAVLLAVKPMAKGAPLTVLITYFIIGWLQQMTKASGSWVAQMASTMKCSEQLWQQGTDITSPLSLEFQQFLGLDTYVAENNEMPEDMFLLTSCIQDWLQHQSQSDALMDQQKEMPQMQICCLSSSNWDSGDWWRRRAPQRMGWTASGMDSNCSWK